MTEPKIPRFSEVFARPRVLLPVIHCKDEPQIQRNAALVIEQGADGLFLINQGGLSVPEILRVASKLAETLPFVGVNLLGRDLESVMFAVAREKLHGFWTDDAEYKPFPTAGLWFGSVAFKYRALVAAHNYGAVVRQAVAIGVDVVTTSGPGTGRAPDVSKIQTMSEALGEHPLAIASGITPENVEAFLPFAQAYLVATGIEREFGEFDAARVRALADKIHA